MRSQDIRYFGYGLSIGALIAALFFTFVFFTSRTNARTNSIIPITIGLLQPSPVVTIPATSTIQPTSTLLPLATPPTVPTATQSSTDLMVISGELNLLGPLTTEQQFKLYEASLTFVAPTYQQSKKISVLINNARFSDPSSTCGPLSLAILQSAGILGDVLEPHDFFLLNPDLAKDREILEKAFPKESYEDTRYKIKLNKVDWVVQPLLPGDFIYIYMGNEGNFEHMLVVNRVDSLGRAYSVTNYNTEEGFIIKEVMLYDPGDPSVGIFAQWTKREKQLLGSTGFAGYEVWRMKE